MLGKRFASFYRQKNRRAYDIADVAKLSFLAWTRNLMILACRMCFLFVAGICAVIEIRSLVLARDDAVAGICHILYIKKPPADYWFCRRLECIYKVLFLIEVAFDALLGCFFELFVP